MKTGKRWSPWLLLALPLLLHASGCAMDRANIEKNLIAHQSPLRHEGVLERYRVGCPDVIELTIADRPEFSGRRTIEADGRIALGDYGNLRIEGKTIPEITRLVAAETGASQESVQARVVEFRSQHVLLYGEVTGFQRSVPYRGQETVVDLLQRVGGITPGAEPRDVYVVRPHLGDNQRPEVFHVNLHAIVLKNDHKTNYRLLPFDQIYVGQTRQAQVEKAIPPWARRVYQAIWDTRPGAAGKAAKDDGAERK